jgi:hypothetical protein
MVAIPAGCRAVQGRDGRMVAVFKVVTGEWLRCRQAGVLFRVAMDEWLRSGQAVGPCKAATGGWSLFIRESALFKM